MGQNLKKIFVLQAVAALLRQITNKQANKKNWHTNISIAEIWFSIAKQNDIFIWPLQYPHHYFICANNLLKWQQCNGGNESPQYLISKRWKLWKFFNLVFKIWIRLKNVLLADPSRLCMRFRARCLAGTIVRTFIGCWNFIGILRQLLPFKLQTAFERHLFASLAAKYVNEAALLVTHHCQAGWSLTICCFYLTPPTEECSFI